LNLRAAASPWGVRTCWLRINNTHGHAEAYRNYTFTGVSPEQTTPAGTGESVLNDSIGFGAKVSGVQLDNEPHAGSGERLPGDNLR